MKKFLIVASALLMLVSCAKDMANLETTYNGQLQTINVNVAQFDCNDATKTAVTPAGAFTWSANDQIGIYPLQSSVGTEQTSQQIIFKVQSGAAASSATFTGTGWGLVTNGDFSYFSYYPYSQTTTHDVAVVEYSDNLNQESNTSTAHLGVNDFLYAPAVTPTSAETAAFNFYHVSALVEFEITVPDSCKTKTFTKVEVSANSNVFTTSGKYNPSTTVARDTAAKQYGPALFDTDSTNKLKLNFNNGDGFTPDASGKLHAYFLIAPAKVKGETITVNVWDSNNVKYTADKTFSVNIESQNHLICAYSPEQEGPKDLSKNGTANCYIVPKEGSYKFLANIKGNGYDPLDATNHNADAPIVVKGCTPVVLWETVNTTTTPSVGTIISNVELNDNYITFDATGTAGNALIALKDASGKIVWSWHIWSTDVDLNSKAQTYGGVKMMDRNIGAIADNHDANKCRGFNYQWGRPFPLRAGVRSNIMQTTNSGNWSSVSTSATYGTLSYSAEHPMTFIGGISTNWNWYFGSDPEFWGNKKTMYDPSPVGWKVPSEDVYASSGWDDTNMSYNSSENICIFPTDICYPGVLWIDRETKKHAVHDLVGNYYTSTTGPDAANTAYAMQCFGSTELAFYPGKAQSKAYGFNVRCCKDVDE